MALNVATTNSFNLTNALTNSRACEIQHLERTACGPTQGSAAGLGSHAPSPPPGTTSAARMQQGGAETRAEGVSPPDGKESMIQQLQEQLGNMELEQQRIKQTIDNLRDGNNIEEAKEILQRLRTRSATCTSNHTTDLAEESDANSAESHLSDNRLPIGQPTDDYNGFELVDNWPMDEQETDYNSQSGAAALNATETATEQLENQILQLRRQLDIEADMRKRADEMVQSQTRLAEKYKAKVQQMMALMESEKRLRLMRTEELTNSLDEKNRILEDLNRRLCESELKVTELEAQRMVDTERLNEYLLMVDQIIEHEEAFKAEHTDLMKMNKEKEKFERYYRIYETERDRALQRALAAEHEISSLQNNRKQSRGQSNYVGISHSASSQRQSNRNLSANVWPHDPTYDHFRFTEPAVTRTTTSGQNTSPTVCIVTPLVGETSLTRSRPLEASSNHDSTLGATGVTRMSQSAMGNKDKFEIPNWFSSSAVELQGAKPHNKRPYEATGSTADQRFPSSATALKTAAEWNCQACGHPNQRTSQFCTDCGTIDAIQSHRLS